MLLLLFSLCCCCSYCICFHGNVTLLRRLNHFRFSFVTNCTECHYCKMLSIDGSFCCCSSLVVWASECVLGTAILRHFVSLMLLNVKESFIVLPSTTHTSQPGKRTLQPAGWNITGASTRGRRGIRAYHRVPGHLKYPAAYGV